MAKRLLLVRHGRLGASYLGRLIGATDPPLDPEGERQGKLLAERVTRWAPQTCFCSPMQRCRQMAALVAPNLPPHVDLDLREIDFGRWENRTFAEAAAEDPSLADRWAEMSPQFGFSGGETVGDFLRRVRAAADRLDPCRSPDGVGRHPRRGDPHDDLPLARPGAASVRGVRRAVCRDGRDRFVRRQGRAYGIGAA